MGVALRNVRVVTRAHSSIERVFFNIPNGSFYTDENCLTVTEDTEEVFRAENIGIIIGTGYDDSISLNQVLGIQIHGGACNNVLDYLEAEYGVIIDLAS